MGYLAYSLSGKVLKKLSSNDADRLTVLLLSTTIRVVNYVYQHLGHRVAASCVAAALFLDGVAPKEALGELDSLPVSVFPDGSITVCPYYYWKLGVFDGRHGTVCIVPGDNVLLGLSLLIKGVVATEPTALGTALHFLPAPYGRIYRDTLAPYADIVDLGGESIDCTANGRTIEKKLLELYESGALLKLHKRGAKQPGFFKDLGGGAQTLLFSDIGDSLFDRVGT